MKVQKRIATIVIVLALVGISIVLLRRPSAPGPPAAKEPVFTGNSLPRLSQEATNATLSSLPQTQSRRGVRFDPLQLMKESLELTDDQTKKLEPILKEQQSRMVALRRDTALSRQDRLAKSKEMQQAWDSRIKSVLTAQQVEKWRNLKFTIFNKQ